MKWSYLLDISSSFSIHWIRVSIRRDDDTNPPSLAYPVPHKLASNEVSNPMAFSFFGVWGRM